ncbi:hypothetical protein DL98DRAFT_589359 [Cadophora sp. DSE1049]|nr:hypothetical protein DL98DRAFT_589359 [Cadophora sp. DSE1049]
MDESTLAHDESTSERKLSKNQTLSSQSSANSHITNAEPQTLPITSDETASHPQTPQNDSIMGTINLCTSTSSTTSHPSKLELLITNQPFPAHLRLDNRQVHEKYMRGVSANNLKTFTLFPKLSSELRLKVWEYCGPEPSRITAIPTTIGRVNMKWTVPAVLQVCKESRHEFLARDGVTRGYGMYK